MESVLSIKKDLPGERANGIVIQAGEFQKWYEAHYKRVYNYISFRINNHHDTEELVSQVFERVITKYHTYDPDRSSPEVWLMGIARNTITDYFRARKKGSPVSLDQIADFISGNGQPDEIAVINENNRSLIEALSRLSEKERNIVALKFAAGLKNTEIAEVMGISDSNIGVILFRGLKKLRGELEKEGLSK